MTFSGNKIDRDSLMRPDVVIEDYAAGILLKLVFDAIAQAASLPGSHNYDATGRRKIKRAYSHQRALPEQFAIMCRPVSGHTTAVRG
jgi:hypothetical protein